MSPYLRRLKSVLAENTICCSLTKLTEAPSALAKAATPATDRTDKRPFVSSVSTSGTPFSERYACEPRPAEIDGDGALTLSVHDVHNVQNVQNDPPSRHFVQIEQRAAESAHPSATLHSGAPNDWGDRIAALISRPCPVGFAPQRWAVLCNGVERFAREWALNATSLGWSFEELFALREPFVNGSLQGAAWFIGDSTVTAVTTDAITLRTEGGATQRVYRRPAA
jgi:hypothetical protein